LASDFRDALDRASNRRSHLSLEPFDERLVLSDRLVFGNRLALTFAHVGNDLVRGDAELVDDVHRIDLPRQSGLGDLGDRRHLCPLGDQHLARNWQEPAFTDDRIRSDAQTRGIGVNHGLRNADCGLGIADCGYSNVHYPGFRLLDSQSNHRTLGHNRSSSASILKLYARTPSFDFAAPQLRSGRTGWDIALTRRFGVDALVACAARTSVAQSLLLTTQSFLSGITPPPVPKFAVVAHERLHPW
jgi:hypothetical protein